MADLAQLDPANPANPVGACVPPRDGAEASADGGATGEGPEAAWVTQIGALEVLKSAACALQARISVAFAEAERARQEGAGVAVSRAGRGIPSQIGLARRESPNKGQILLGLAQCLVGEMPFTLAALARGELNEWRATIIARETAVLSREDRAVVDRELCGPGGNAGSLGDAAIGRVAREIGQRLDPGAAWARAQKAVRERGVSVRPAPDCMVRLCAYLPVVQGVGVYAALSQAADAAIAAGQQGTAGRQALMADELIARILAPGLAGGRVVPEPAVEVQLIMTDRTLFGLDDDPAHLTGYGPIPAPLARRIAAGRRPSDQHGVQPGDQPAGQAGDQAGGQDEAEGAVRWIRRLYKQPWNPGTEGPNTESPGTGSPSAGSLSPGTSGMGTFGAGSSGTVTSGTGSSGGGTPGARAGLVAMDSRRREFPGGIRRFVIARDQFCRTPWCDAPIRHIDHIDPAGAGGPTSAANAQGLCEACNYAKQAPGWQQTCTGSDAEVTTTTPTGHQYVSSPPRPPGAWAGSARSAVPAPQAPAS